MKNNIRWGPDVFKQAQQEHTYYNSLQMQNLLAVRHQSNHCITELWLSV